MKRLTPEYGQERLFQMSMNLPFVKLFEHGSLEVEFYRPDLMDRQQPHSRDEVYVIVAGYGLFERDGVVQPFVTGELLFVPAGMAHRFVEFSLDFATWVIFYGPEGGE